MAKFSVTFPVNPGVFIEVPNDISEPETVAVKLARDYMIRQYCLRSSPFELEIKYFEIENISGDEFCDIIATSADEFEDVEQKDE